jgi:hypothetical protein
MVWIREYVLLNMRLSKNVTSRRRLVSARNHRDIMVQGAA